jgi:hypothetical protein
MQQAGRLLRPTARELTDHYLTSVEFYNMLTGEWEQLAALDAPRGYHSMGLLGAGLPAVLGGATDLEGITADVLILHEGVWADPGFSLSRAKIQGGSVVGHHYQNLWNCE